MMPFTNSLDAVSERDFVLDLLYACAVLGVHLSRLGEEWVLWTSAEFGFATIDDAYSSGSSIMPQKKNPDAYELMRGKTGRLIGDLNGVLIILKGLPLGYSKDLQEDKEPLFDAVDSVLAMLAVLPEMLRTARFDGGRMAEAAGGFASRHGLADFLAAKGIPFREAHHAVGRLAEVRGTRSVARGRAARRARGGASRAFGGAGRAAYAARERAKQGLRRLYGPRVRR